MPVWHVVGVEAGWQIALALVEPVVSDCHDYGHVMNLEQ
jgi:hypothetical protein